VIVKFLKIWVKSSLLAMTYDVFDDGSDKVQLAETIGAVVLGWYAALSLLSGAVKHLVDSLSKKEGEARLYSCCLLPFVLSAFHSIGVFLCASHDFSVAHLRCTPLAENIDMTAGNASVTIARFIGYGCDTCTEHMHGLTLGR